MDSQTNDSNAVIAPGTVPTRRRFFNLDAFTSRKRSPTLAAAETVIKKLADNPKLSLAGAKEAIRTDPEIQKQFTIEDVETTIGLAYNVTIVVGIVIGLASGGLAGIIVGYVSGIFLGYLGA